MHTSDVRCRGAQFDKSERLKFLDYKLEELGIGVNRKAVHTVHEATPLVSVLETFVDKRVSALPVIDDNGEVTNLYAKFDVIVCG
jgi:5'-AMP-activated protein kinase regulatory gamma subunit